MYSNSKVVTLNYTVSVSPSQPPAPSPSQNFKEWAEDFHGYTYQTKEILNTLELYIQMTIRGRIDQAPSKPPSISSGPDTGVSGSSYTRLPISLLLLMLCYIVQWPKVSLYT